MGSAAKCGRQTERPYSARPSHGRQRSSGRTPPCRPQSHPELRERGSSASDSRRTHGAWPRSQTLFQMRWAVWPCNRRQPSEQGPRPRVKSCESGPCLLHYVQCQLHRPMTSTAENGAMADEIAGPLRGKLHLACGSLAGPHVHTQLAEAQAVCHVHASQHQHHRLPFLQRQVARIERKTFRRNLYAARLRFRHRTLHYKNSAKNQNQCCRGKESVPHTPPLGTAFSSGSLLLKLIGRDDSVTTAVPLELSLSWRSTRGGLSCLCQGIVRRLLANSQSVHERIQYPHEPSHTDVDVRAAITVPRQDPAILQPLPLIASGVARDRLEARRNWGLDSIPRLRENDVRLLSRFSCGLSAFRRVLPQARHGATREARRLPHHQMRVNRVFALRR